MRTCKSEGRRAGDNGMSTSLTSFFTTLAQVSFTVTGLLAIAIVGDRNRKGSDRGIDGMLNFLTEKNKTEKILVQVKSGHVKSGDIRDLHGVLQREAAAMGVFISLEEPSKDMRSEAGSAGYYHSDLWQKDYPLIQILTIEEIFAGQGIQMPPSAYGTFKQAGKVKKEDATQDNFNLRNVTVTWTPERTGCLKKVTVTYFLMPTLRRFHI